MISFVKKSKGHLEPCLQKKEALLPVKERITLKNFHLNNTHHLSIDTHKTGLIVEELNYLFRNTVIFINFVIIYFEMSINNILENIKTSGF